MEVNVLPIPTQASFVSEEKVHRRPLLRLPKTLPRVKKQPSFPPVLTFPVNILNLKRGGGQLLYFLGFFSALKDLMKNLNRAQFSSSSASQPPSIEN